MQDDREENMMKNEGAEIRPLFRERFTDEAYVGDADSFFSAAISDFPTVTQLEERYMRVVLKKTHGRKDKAAQILGMNRRTLYRKEREYGLVPARRDAEHLAAAAELPAEHAAS